MNIKHALAYCFLCVCGIVHAQTNAMDVADAALSITNNTIRYVAGYVKIPYPNGDVPADTGVCTDVVVRAYRLLGIDLQKEVHEDMLANFSLYSKKWRLKRADSNIDHRRVPNLMVFFKRKGVEKPITKNAENYIPGDIVCWKLFSGATHIGIVAKPKTADGKRHQIVHNIGGGQMLTDCLFSYTIIGHYRYPK